MALKKVGKKVTSMFKKEDAFTMAREYADVSAKIKELEAYKKDLATKLKQCAVEYGVKDDKGSSYTENDSFVVGNVAKKSVKLNQERALDYCKTNKLDCIETVEVVNEDILEQLVSEGAVSIEDVESLMDIKTTYSVSVVEKEEMPEVEQKSVARRKK